MASSSDPFIDDSREPTEWLAEAEKLAQRVIQTDARTAYARVLRGQYKGTTFAAELRQLMFLAHEDDSMPHAAE